MREGILFVLSGPSGAGKGTVLKRVFEIVDNLHFSVSATTRAPRPGEKDGVDYHYVSNEAFDKMIENGEMLEYVSKFTNHYGTPRSSVEKKLKEGKDVFLEIETEGGKNVRKIMPECVSIFVAPPSTKELVNRLSLRNTESESNRALRYETSKEEMRCAYEYDYVVVNDIVEDCARLVAAIIFAERSKVKRNRHTLETIQNN